MSDLDDEIRNLVYEHVAEQTRMIENDVILALGPLVHLPKFIIRRMGFSVAYQTPPTGGPSQYRGIERHNVLLIDRHPDWPWLGWVR